MTSAAGFILHLPADRMEVLKQTYKEGFAQPVPEFEHSRNLPLICFVVAGDRRITHLAMGSRGRIAGTGLRRLNLSGVIEIKEQPAIDLVVSLANSKIQKRLAERIEQSDLVTNKTFQGLIDAVSLAAPSAAVYLQRYSEQRQQRIDRLPARTRAMLAEQKEAVATALTVAGIDRNQLDNWDYTEATPPRSFLDGLTQVRLREDPIIINDLNQFPGYSAVTSSTYGAVTFEDLETRLTVVLANRLPLEQQLGTDLIYYNETYKCFLMVQYKAMETEGSDHVFRLPNHQLEQEIERMDAALEELRKIPSENDADGFRFNENPFFLKFCPRLVFKPDNIGLSKGIYVHLDYWKRLAHHPTLVGKKGGVRLSYRNARRYLDNTAFVSLVGNGWIGTNIGQSAMLGEYIRETLESGRAVVFAVATDKVLQHHGTD